MFANNHHGDGRVSIWIPAAPGVQAAMIEEAPDTYFRPPYVGVSGWVGVQLANVDEEQLGALIREGFRVVARRLVHPAVFAAYENASGSTAARGDSSQFQSGPSGSPSPAACPLYDLVWMSNLAPRSTNS